MVIEMTTGFRFVPDSTGGPPCVPGEVHGSQGCDRREGTMGRRWGRRPIVQPTVLRKGGDDLTYGSMHVKTFEYLSCNS